MLNDSERMEHTLALESWARALPPWQQTEPALRIAAVGELTPVEAVEAVQRRTPTGEAILEFLEHSLRRSSMDEVVARLRPHPSPPGPVRSVGF